MKNKEKFLSAFFTIALGILLIVMKKDLISIFMTIFGIALIILGLLDFLAKDMTGAVVKCVVGALIIVFGWTIASAVVYIVAAGLLILGILGVYDLMRSKNLCARGFDVLRAYALPIGCIVIGLILFFNRWDWIFVLAGICTVIEGALLFMDALE